MDMPCRLAPLRGLHSSPAPQLPQSLARPASSPVKLAATNPALYQELTRFALMPQTPINLDRMLRAGKAMTHKKMLLSALFVHNELPIRLAKRVFELDSLPTKLLEEPAILKLRDDYLKSWKSVVDFPRFTSEKDPHTPPTKECEPRIPGYALGVRPTHEFIDSLRSFASIGPNLEGLVPPENLPAHVLAQDAFLRLLQDIKWRHRADQVFMSLGIQSFKGAVPSMIFDHAGLQGFLDSFNRGRIGVRLLMGHQIAMTLDFVKGPKSMSTVGIIDVETDIKKVVWAAWEMAAEVARRVSSNERLFVWLTDALSTDLLTWLHSITTQSSLNFLPATSGLLPTTRILCLPTFPPFFTTFSLNSSKTRFGLLSNPAVLERTSSTQKSGWLSSAATRI